MIRADIFNSECLRFQVIQQEEPCWLGEVVLEGVRTAGGRAPATRIRRDVPGVRGTACAAGWSPELVQLDRQGYPVFLDTPVPFWLERNVQQAVAMCPALALRTEPGTALTAPSRSAIASPRTLVSGGGGIIQG